MAKPIPEAVLDRLAHEVYQVHCDTPIRPFPNDSHWPKWRAVVQHVADHFTAAQQQGQAVALDRMAIRLLVEAGFVTEGKANEALRIAHGFDKGPLAPPSAPVCTCPSGDGSLRWPCPAHPPSAPVGVEARRHIDVLRLLRQLEPPHPEEHAAIDAAIEALAQQPAAVDEAGKVPVSESALRYCIRELNGARRGDNAEGRAELVHHVLTAWLDLATQHQEPTT